MAQLGKLFERVEAREKAAGRVPPAASPADEGIGPLGQIACAFRILIALEDELVFQRLLQADMAMALFGGAMFAVASTLLPLLLTQALPPVLVHSQQLRLAIASVSRARARPA